MINYIAEYVSLCAALHNGYGKTSVKKHNVAMKELEKLFHHAKHEQDKSFYLELLQNESSQVQLIAAAHCLGLNEYIREAKKVLRTIAKDKTNPELAFEAQATLDVWKEQGYLQF